MSNDNDKIEFEFPSAIPGMPPLSALIREGFAAFPNPTMTPIQAAEQAKQALMALRNMALQELSIGELEVVNLAIGTMQLFIERYTNGD